ncbi:TPA: fimbrial protein [Proteus mirabilis]|nr:fimbrial protein [Proteus mirabilis]HEK2723801.1 fimbrial protein [Proteus mirabilis]
MFKKSLLAISLLTLSNSIVFAAVPNAKLKVNGDIQPPTCTINGETSETTVEYTFDVTPGLFPAKGDLTLKPQSKKIVVTCDAKTYLAFIPTDNRAGTENKEGETYFGLGNYKMKGDGEESVDAKIGYYTVLMQNATVKEDLDSEEKKANVINTRKGSTISLTLIKNESFGWSLRNSAEYVSGQVFAADFEVKPTINSVLKNSDGDAKLDGLATLTFQFGI